MIYRFSSRNDGDVIMTQPVAERVLGAMGKDVSREGIVEPAQMDAALRGLQQAIDADDAARSARGPDDDAGDGRVEAADGARTAVDAVSLRRRAWPLVEMLKRALVHDEPVTWRA